MSNTSTVKRFQSWELRGNGKIEGVWPIPDGDQPNNYTEIEYGSKGEILGIKEWAEGHPKPLERKPTFDSGRLVQSEYNDPIDNIRGTNSYEYNQKGHLCARQEVDTRGKVRFRIEVRCDDRGRIAEEKVYDRSKKLVERHVYEYDNNNLMTKDSMYGGDKGDVYKGYFALEYDDQKHLIRRAWYDTTGKEKNAFRYKYDSAHRRTEMGVEREGKPAVTSQFVYNDVGRKVEVRFVNDKGESLASERSSEPGKFVHESFVPYTPAEYTERDQAIMRGETDLSKLINLSKKDMNTMLMAAYSHFENGRFQQAYGLFDSLVMLDATNIYHKAGAGAAALQMGQAQTALNWYERALMLDAKHIPSLVGRAEALLHLGKVDQALEQFKVVFSLSTAQNDPTIQRARAIVVAISQSQSEGANPQATASSTATPTPAASSTAAPATISASKLQGGNPTGKR